MVNTFIVDLKYAVLTHPVKKSKKLLKHRTDGQLEKTSKLLNLNSTSFAWVGDGSKILQLLMHVGPFQTEGSKIKRIKKKIISHTHFGLQIIIKKKKKKQTNKKSLMYIASQSPQKSVRLAPVSKLASVSSTLYQHWCTYHLNLLRNCQISSNKLAG